MNITYHCPACDRTVSLESAPEANALECPSCAAERPVPPASYREQKLQRCILCGCDDLFVRKDFSQVLGVTCVVAGFVVSSVFWYYRLPLWAYGVLFLTAVIDFALYLLCGNLLECYRCKAQFRNVPGLDTYEPFDLETHEKHRQQDARLKEAERATIRRSEKTS